MSSCPTQDILLHFTCPNKNDNGIRTRSSLPKSLLNDHPPEGWQDEPPLFSLHLNGALGACREYHCGFCNIQLDRPLLIGDVQDRDQSFFIVATTIGEY